MYQAERICPTCGSTHQRFMEGKCLVCWSFSPEWKAHSTHFYDAISKEKLRTVYDDMFDMLYSQIVVSYRDRFQFWSLDSITKSVEFLFESSLDLCGDISFLDDGISVKWSVIKNHYPRQMRPINPRLSKKYDTSFETWMTPADSCIFLQYSPCELSETCMASIRWTSVDNPRGVEIVVPEQEFRETWGAAGFRFEWAGYSIEDDKCTDLLVPPKCENTKMLFKLTHGVYPLSV